MNKRHYEHTLPNIRGSLSNTYLEELSRYYKVKLSASNENKRLTASFKNKSLDEIIRFIEKVLNVKIEKVKQ